MAVPRLRARPVGEVPEFSVIVMVLGSSFSISMCTKRTGTACLKPFRTPDTFCFIFITAAMAFHAVFILVDPFLNVLCTDLRSRVLVTAVAGVTSIIVVDVAGRTAGVVVPVEAEVLLVLKGGRQPGLLRVALRAVALDLQVQGIPWSAMTAVALFLQPLLQQLVRELTDGAEGLHAPVIAVAGDTILLDQLLMEGDVLLLLGNGHPLGRLQADF